MRSWFLSLVYSFGKHIMYNLEEVINMDVGLDLLVEPLTFDALYLHAQAFSVLSITELALRKRVKTHREVLSHLSKALQLLQDRLLVEDSSKFSINTVWVMLSLTAHAQISGDYEAVRTHIQGLHTVVSLNGGRSSCEIPKHILMEVLRYDLSLALNRGHQTVFFRNSQGEPLPEYPDFVLPTQVQGIGLSNATLSKMPVEIDYELGQAWEILKQFSEVMNLAYKSKYKQAKSTLHETMVAVMYRLLYMKFDPSSFDEAIRLGLLALSSNLFLQWKIGKPVYIDLPRSLKDCLLKLQISEGFNSILIWLMMIGAISVFTKADDRQKAMGQQYSASRPGTKLRVIGAGLPRTGTAAFSRALEILLDGPIYHGGTQTTLGPESEIQTWIKVLSQWPPIDQSSKVANLELIKSRTEGFAAITDSPGCGLVEELMTLYPDAKVICTVRDVSAWEKSLDGVKSSATQWFLRFVLFPLPSLRFFVDYIDVLRDQWLTLYGEIDPASGKIWDQHMAWLKETVPQDRLIFYDVRDGWDPLCRALDLPVPADIPFPRINDSKAIDDFAKAQVQRGLTRWALIFVTATTVTLALFNYRWHNI
ncbi:hypothetical protein BX600DRAFT_515563 [Xylariales sp. PMI_506]|nr:hypothetical protein BX600DRAFT_515563 [Xylariales sp. PMI_506]